jgi:hypothetical protein
MSNTDITIKNALGLQSATVAGISDNTSTQIVVADSGNKIADDAERARLNLLDVLKKTTEACSDLLKLAKESQEPRAYEVLADMLKNQAELSEQFLKVHEQQKNINKVDKADSVKSISVANAVFVGTTAELLDQYRGTNHKVIEHSDLNE